MNRKITEPSHSFFLGMRTSPHEDLIVRWLDNKNILINGYDWSTVLDTDADIDLPLGRIDGYNVDGYNNYLVVSRRILVDENDSSKHQIARSDILTDQRLIETIDVSNFSLEIVKRSRYSGEVSIAVSNTTPHHVIAYQNTLLVQDISSHKTIKKIKFLDPRYIKFTPNGQYLFALNLDFCLSVFETQGWKRVWKSDDNEMIPDYCVSHHQPTDSIVYANSKYHMDTDGINFEGVDIRQVLLSEGIARTLQENIGIGDEKIRTLTCSSDGNFMAVALDNRLPTLGGRRGRMLVWKMPHLDLVWAERFQFYMDPLPLFVAFSPSSKKMVAGCENKEIRIWEMPTETMSYNADEVNESTIVSSTLISEYTQISEMNPQDRGRSLQGLLKSILDSEGIDSSYPFRPLGEEIDGSFDLFYRTFLIEAKWTAKPVPESELLKLRGKVEGKLVGTLGVFWSISGYSSDCISAIEKGKDINILLFDGDDLEAILNEEVTFSKLLLMKYQLAGKKGISYCSWSEFRKNQ